METCETDLDDIEIVPHCRTLAVRPLHGQRLGPGRDQICAGFGSRAGNIARCSQQNCWMTSNFDTGEFDLRIFDLWAGSRNDDDKG